MPRPTKLRGGSLAPIVDRPGRWRYRACIGGRKFRKSFRTLTAAEATTRANSWYTTWEAKAESEAQAVALGLPRGRRVSELLERYREWLFTSKRKKTRAVLREGTKRVYEHTFARFTCFFVTQLGDPAVEHVRPEDVTAYFVWVSGRRSAKNHDPKRGRSERTVTRDYILLRDAFEYALDHDWTDRSPVRPARHRPIAGDTRKPVLLTDDELQQLLSGCAENEQLRTFLMVQDAVGARPGSETLWLRWDDTDLRGRRLTFRETEQHQLKTPASSRTIPISAALVQQLRTLMDWYLDRGVESAWVFCQVGRNGEPTGERIDSLQSAIRRLVKRTLPASRPPTCDKDSGRLHNLRGHDFRHRVAKRHKDRGFSLELRRDFLGHGNPSQTDHYAGRADPETLRPLVEEVAAAR